MKKTCFMLLLFLMIFVFSGCAFENEENGKIKIVATQFPQYDFAREIAGDKADIHLLVSPGDDAHSYEPSLEDITKIRNCDIFVYIGGESEQWAENIVNEKDNSFVFLKLMDKVELLKEEAKEGMQDVLRDEENDEHIWTSPKNAIKICEEIVSAICEADKENSAYYQENAENYIEELEKLDEELETIQEDSEKNILLFEGRFPFRYLCSDYGFDYYASFSGCSAETEVKLSTISFLINKIKENDIKVVFCTEDSDEKVADIICSDTGAEKKLLHSCGNVSKKGFAEGETYLSLMKENVKNIKEALDSAAD